MTHASASETSKPRLSLRIFAIILAVMPMSLFGYLWGTYGWVYYIIVRGPGHPNVNNISWDRRLTKNHRSASQESGPWSTPSGLPSGVLSTPAPRLLWIASSKLICGFMASLVLYARLRRITRETDTQRARSGTWSLLLYHSWDGCQWVRLLLYERLNIWPCTNTSNHSFVHFVPFLLDSCDVHWRCHASSLHFNP